MSHIETGAREQMEWGVGLECLSGSTSLVIPATWVGQIVECEASGPLPLAVEGVIGVTIIADHSYVVIGDEVRPNGRFTTKLVVLLDPESPGARFGIEISDIGAFVRVGRAPAGERGDVAKTPLARWTVPATTQGGARLRWLDAAAMLDALEPLPGGARRR
jgi:hypothetical protein